MTESLENLEADLADVIHSARIHADSGVCHGDNDGCEGGPDQVDLEYAERAMEYVRAAMPNTDWQKP
jgi:hypothetical protein